MVEIVTKEYENIHKTRGRKDGPTLQERVEITLKYLRQYNSQRYLAIVYNVSKSCISPIVKWTVKVLVSNSNFSLPNRVDSIIDMSEDRIINATETKIDRSIKHQEDWYSWKKKQHTIKTQIEIGVKTMLIYFVRFSKGSTHDFKLFKDSKSDYSKENTLFVDKGYMIITNIHNHSIIPIRASKKHKLTKEEKWYNNEISKIRIFVEHVNAFIKKFTILSTRFRNRRKHFKLYMSLICGIYNFETANL